MTGIDARRYGSLYLPLVRSNEGLADDEAYVASAMEQVQQILRYREFGSGTRVLDLGCGQARLAIGLMALDVPLAGYCGIDTNEASIEWCKRWLQPCNRKFEFHHVPAHNARYNAAAVGTPPLSVPDRFFDVAFSNSVFSHMLADHVAFYLAALHDAVKPDGVVYMTAFIEDQVGAVEENPAGYLGKESKGRLHRVRYETSHFFSLVDAAGLKVVDFHHRGIGRTGQSIIVATRSC